MVWVAEKLPGKPSRLVDKAFGNLVYEKDMSEDFGGAYQILDWKKSIERTE